MRNPLRTFVAYLRARIFLKKVRIGSSLFQDGYESEMMMLEIRGDEPDFEYHYTFENLCAIPEVAQGQVQAHRDWKRRRDEKTYG